MTTAGLLMWAVVSAVSAHAGWSEDLFGFPTDEVQMNAVCQGLLAQGGGADRERVIAKFRDHRVRRLDRLSVEPSVERTFRVNARSGPRDLAKLAGHLRGVERWVSAGQGPVYGFVLTGPDQILAHERRLTEVGESLQGLLHESDQMRSGARLVINLTFSYLFALGVQSGPMVLAALSPLFLIVSPYSANRALVLKDFAARKARASRARMYANPEAEDWTFSSRTYRVFDDVAKSVATLDLDEVANAMNQENWWRLSPLSAQMQTFHVFRRKGWKAAREHDAQSRAAYVLVDTLSHFDVDSGEPEVILAVRMTTSNPRRVFEAKLEPRANAGPSSLPAAR